jgi:ribosomal protein S18 acetylase RimI-like enzyme
VDVTVRREGDRWLAYRGAAPVGELRTLVRPDRRCLLLFGDCEEAAYAPLVTAAASLGQLCVSVDDTDGTALRRFTALGFVIDRHEHNYRIPVAAPVPATRADGVDLVSAADADLDRLRLLDDAVRQDIPGADGWRWDPEGFRAQTFGEDFDPATYLVAVHRDTGEYVGLIRVWMGRQPRLGCVAVLRRYRRTRVAAALLAAVAGELRARGIDDVITEVAAENRASNALIARSGAVRVGGTYELSLP